MRNLRRKHKMVTKTRQGRKEVDFVKLQVQERDEDLTKIKEEFHQNKRKHPEEVLSMKNQWIRQRKGRNFVKTS